MARFKCRCDCDVFALPSNANRDLGIFLIFTGVVGGVPLYYLYRMLILHTPVWDWRQGATFGLFLVLIGLALLAWTRRTFRVREEFVEVRDGLLRLSVRYPYHDEPMIRLQPLAAEVRGRQVEFWQVMLVDGKYEFLLDSRLDRMQESRCLAEFLAKRIGCPLRVRREAGVYLDIEAADLDLPLGERVHRYPSLLGPRIPRPEVFPIREEGTGSTRAFSWGGRTSSLVPELSGFFLAALAFSLIPISGAQQYSLWDLARLQGDYRYFQVLLGFFTLALLFLFGYRVKVALTPEQIQARTSLWGLPLWSRVIPLNKLEEILVRSFAQSTLLKFISDEEIFSLRVLRRDLGDYLASELRHTIAGATETQA
jgi:hypothetical protein